MVQEVVAKTPYVKYLDMFDLPLGTDGKPRADLFVEDKLHFNAEGNRLMAQRIKAFLDKSEPAKK